jgi:DNA-binding LytR/AlgR family response regulator
MLDGKRILIVEDQFLIALDIQRVLEAAHAGRMIFARTVAEAQSLADRWPDFDLAVVQIARGDKDALALAGRLQAAGAAVVVTTANPALPFAGFTPPPGTLLIKPFGDDDLIAACLAALAARDADR